MNYRNVEGRGGGGGGGGGESMNDYTNMKCGFLFGLATPPHFLYLLSLLKLA